MAALPRVPDRVRELAARYAAALRGALGERVRDVILFGSQARGEAHEGSDVDVAVIVEGLTFAEKRRAIDVATDLGLEAGMELSQTVVDAATWAKWQRQERPFARDVARDGIRA